MAGTVLAQSSAGTGWCKRSGQGKNNHFPAAEDFIGCYVLPAEGVGAFHGLIPNPGFKGHCGYFHVCILSHFGRPLLNDDGMISVVYVFMKSIEVMGAIVKRNDSCCADPFLCYISVRAQKEGDSIDNEPVDQTAAAERRCACAHT